VFISKSIYMWRALRSLRLEVPGVANLTVGANFTDRAHGCTHGLVVELRDRQALAEYAAHPRHVEVAAALRRDAELWALDYEY
jgi:Stress responsive A/B Barrel Domain